MKLSAIRSLVSDIRKGAEAYNTEDRSIWRAVHRQLSQLARHAGDEEKAVALMGKLAGVELFVCSHCEEWRDNGHSHTPSNGDVICDVCRCCDFFCCDDCEDVYHNDTSNSVRGGDRTVCSGCYTDYACCSECEYTAPASDMNRVRGNWYCEDCQPSSNSDLVQEYSTNVLQALDNPRWLSAPGELTDKNGNSRASRPTLWMGFELEIIAKNDDVETAAPAMHAALAGRGLLKSDSSIEDDGEGFEIVSLPATLEYHQTQWGDAFFDPLAKHCRGWKHKNCGMHVHVSRAALTALQIGRLLVFVNGDGNAVNNRAFIEAVAGRSETEFCHIYDKRITSASPIPRARQRAMNRENNSRDVGCDCPGCRDIREREAREARLAIPEPGKTFEFSIGQFRRELGTSSAIGAQDRDNNERYQAINLQNSETIEFRIFQSNVARLGFLKNLEFCHAAVTYCAIASNSQLHARDFIAWMETQRGAYPNFTRWAVRELLMKSVNRSKPGAVLPALAA
jgi:hypothetical protein